MGIKKGFWKNIWKKCLVKNPRFLAFYNYAKFFVNYF